MPEITSGAFWDATIYSPKNSAKKLSLPLKKGLDPDKYGSYSREQFAYFFVYKALKKGKPVLEFAAVPVSVAAEVEKDSSALEQYAMVMARKKKLEFVTVARSKIAKYQTISLGNSRLYITGLREVRNATALAFSQAETKLLQCLVEGGELSDDDLNDLFRTLIRSYEGSAPRLYEQMKLKELAECFLIASKDVKAKVILSLVSIANAGTNMIDLSGIGGPKYAGCMNVAFSKELTANGGGVCLVDQSVTGMFERRQRLEL